MVICFFVGNGIISSPAKWIASQDSPYRKSPTFKRPMSTNCFSGINGAGGIESTATWVSRRYETLIKTDQIQHAGSRNRRLSHFIACQYRRIRAGVICFIIVYAIPHRSATSGLSESHRWPADARFNQESIHLFD